MIILLCRQVPDIQLQWSQFVRSEAAQIEASYDIVYQYQTASDSPIDVRAKYKLLVQETSKLNAFKIDSDSFLYGATDLT
mgnify:FL=1